MQIKHDISINTNSNIPIYIQIVNEFERLINEKKIGIGVQLPAINELQKQLKVGRITVINAYKELNNRGITKSTQGKGIYVCRTNTRSRKKIFLLFDAINDYKEILYKSFVKELGTGYDIDIYFHYYNKKQFKRFIDDNVGLYDHYAVLPHFNSDVSQILKKVPKEKLLLIDSDVENLKDGYAGIYQNFEKDVPYCLQSGIHLLSKYNTIKVIKEPDFHFIPDGLIHGLEQFCTLNSFDYEIIEGYNHKNFSKKTAYLAFTNQSLVNLVKYINENKLEPGKDIGIISYDDTPLKSILLNGITVITTDFHNMGTMAAKMIKEKIYSKFENPAQLIIRNSL